jgi:hypothetical protein
MKPRWHVKIEPALQRGELDGMTKASRTRTTIQKGPKTWPNSREMRQLTQLWYQGFSPVYLGVRDDPVVMSSIPRGLCSVKTKQGTSTLDVTRKILDEERVHDD